MHEFLHVIGLWHPQKKYPFNTVIGRNNYVIMENQTIHLSNMKP